VAQSQHRILYSIKNEQIVTVHNMDESHRLNIPQREHDSLANSKYSTKIDKTHLEFGMYFPLGERRGLDEF
jgi:hypothetical protein